MNTWLSEENPILKGLNWLGDWLPQLAIRALMAYEFWLSGIEKLRGQNWFAEVMGMFPFPFDLVPPDISWFLATWTELVGAVALLIGLGTRFFAAVLIFLDLIAWYTVHTGPDCGFTSTGCGFELPLLFLVLLLPLLFSGPGKASLDYLFAQAHTRREQSHARRQVTQA